MVNNHFSVKAGVHGCCCRLERRHSLFVFIGSSELRRLISSMKSRVTSLAYMLSSESCVKRCRRRSRKLVRAPRAVASRTLPPQPQPTSTRSLTDAGLVPPSRPATPRERDRARCGHIQQPGSRCRRSAHGGIGTRCRRARAERQDGLAPRDSFLSPPQKNETADLI